MSITIKNPEAILAIDNSYICDTLKLSSGINTEMTLHEFIDGAGGHLAIRRRQELETNEAYRQIISCAIVAKGDPNDLKSLRFISYRSSDSSGESRMNGLLRLDCGGHVDFKDITCFANGEINLDQTVRNSRDRELSEEISLHGSALTASKRRHYGVITNNHSPMGRVHVGLMELIVVPNSWQLDPSSSEMNLIGYFTADELNVKHNAGEIKMGPWTRFVIESILN
jgi:predicted NUDIX family phosphoesterase